MWNWISVISCFSPGLCTVQLVEKLFKQWLCTGIMYVVEWRKKAWARETRWGICSSASRQDARVLFDLTATHAAVAKPIYSNSYGFLRALNLSFSFCADCVHAKTKYGNAKSGAKRLDMKLFLEGWGWFVFEYRTHMYRHSLVGFWIWHLISQAVVLMRKNFLHNELQNCGEYFYKMFQWNKYTIQEPLAHSSSGADGAGQPLIIQTVQLGNCHTESIRSDLKTNLLWGWTTFLQNIRITRLMLSTIK